MLLLYVLAWVPLTVLDARINAYRATLTRNLTILERQTIQQTLQFHLSERYKLLELVEDDNEVSEQ